MATANYLTTLRAVKKSLPGHGRGPAPTPVSRDRAVTSAQGAVLQVLLASPVGMTLARLSDSMSLHPNTVREHLDALVRSGTVIRSKASAEGRGRPAWVYAAAARPVDAGAQEYAGLASTLAAALHRYSPRPAEDAREAGREWGADLAATSPAPSGPPATRPRRGVVELLDRLRFTPIPRARGRSVRLTTCPLLDAAERYPDVVCSVHQGLVEGALAQWGDRTTTVRIEPFAEPGACLLHLTPATEGASS